MRFRLLLRRLLTGAVALTLAFVGTLVLAPSAALAGPTSLGVSGWQIYPDSAIISNPDASIAESENYHGYPGEFDAAPAVPAQEDSGWDSCGPNAPTRGGVSMCPSASTIDMHLTSIVPVCWDDLNFTFFQALVSLPTNTNVSQFTVNLNGADDGARVSIYNSSYPGGLVIPGSYIQLAGGEGATPDLSPYMVKGEVNRVVITQVDDCPVGNNLNSAQIFLNGSVVPVAPSLDLPNSPLVVPATSASGATVNYSASATDEFGNAIPVSCSPSSGSTFPPGSTTVTCSATDSSNQTSSGTFTVIVETPPTLSPVSNITTEATSSSGAVVTYPTPTATDFADGTDLVSCSPASGSTFLIGQTTVTCSATNTSGQQGSTSFTVSVDDTPAKLVFTGEPPATAQAGVTMFGSPEVTIEDANGNTVTTDTTSMTVSLTGPSGAALTNGASLNCVAGYVAPFVLGVASIGECAIDGPAGTYTFTASDAADGISGVSSNIVVSAGVPSGSESTISASPTTLTADGVSTSTITVQAEDAYGNDESSGGATVALSSTLGSIGAITDQHNGTYTATFTTGILAGTPTITGSINGQPITNSATITLNPGVPSASASSLVASPASVTANGTSTSTLTVTLKDANGNAVPGQSITISPASGSSRLNPATATTNGPGVATFTVSDTKAETVVYTAVDSTYPLTVAETATVSFTPGPPSELVFSVEPPASATAGSALATQPVVTVEDANGNIVTGDTNSVILSLTSPAGASLTCANDSVAFASGVATFSGCSINAAGTYTLGASDSADGLSTASSAIAVQAIPQAITFTSTPPASPTYGGTYTVAATGGGSGNAVTYSIDASSTTGACAVSGSSVSFTGVGSCIVDANQAGNAEYAPAPPVSQQLSIAKAPLSVTANSVTRLFAVANPALSATLGGFVDGQSLATSGVTGAASCTTTATQYSLPGTYPVTCTLGTLAAQNYSFSTPTPGTLSVTVTTTVATTLHASETVSSAQVLALVNGGSLSGSLTVNSGGAFVMTGGSLNGTVTVTGGVVDLACQSGGTITGNVTVASGATLLISGCTVDGNVTLSGGSNLIMSGGTINGNVTTQGAPNSTITITGGTISGNVTSAGGTLSIAGATVKGNVTGGGVVSIGSGAAITGNVTASGGTSLSITGAKISGDVNATGLSGTGSAVSVCGSTIGGNLSVLADAVAGDLEIGGPAASSCAPNSVTGDLTVSGDLASGIAVANNTVGGNLTVALTAVSTTPIEVTDNVVKGNLVVQANFWSTHETTPVVVVSGNTVDHDLQCSGNFGGSSDVWDGFYTPDHPGDLSNFSNGHEVGNTVFGRSAGPGVGF